MPVANSPREFSKLCGMSEPRLSYSGSLDTSPEAEATVLCAVYKFVLDCYAKKKAAPESRRDDARKDQDAGTYPHCT
jgi:hypothetical protein